MLIADAGSINFFRKKVSPNFLIFFQTGTVSYNLTSWLDKNKDPLNDSVVDQMKNASNKSVSKFFCGQIKSWVLYSQHFIFFIS